MAEGIFIVIDGMDGSGKSDMVRVLHDYLSKDNKLRVLTTREPTDGKYGREVRGILENESDPSINSERMLELFIKDREEHLRNAIVPFLNKSNGFANVVISDRYYYSTIAFQATQGLNMKMLIRDKQRIFKAGYCFYNGYQSRDCLRKDKDQEEGKI